jgi:hypothetical protein
MERFNLKKLNEVEGKEQYQVKISYTSIYNAYKTTTNEILLLCYKMFQILFHLCFFNICQPKKSQI